MSSPAAAAQALRQMAEAAALKSGPALLADPQVSAPLALRKTLHELQVHQIELELQNEELRRLHCEMDAQRARYFDLYDLAPVGYCTLSQQGLILEANLTAASMLGVDRNELVMKPISRFIMASDEDAYYLCRKRLVQSGEPQSCEVQMRKEDGTAFWAHLAATSAIDPMDAPVHRVTLSDVTEQKRLSQLLETQNRELDLARQAADKANRAKSDFLLGMSHELRSPLNSILGFAQLMEAGNPPPSPADAARISHILRAGWYLLVLINEVLDLAAVESGRLQVSLESVALPELLPDCHALVEAQAQKKGVSVHFVPCETPCRVLADPTRLKQVIVNLLSNAIKYNRAGGTVTLTCRVVPGLRVHVSVRDTGEGLPPHKLAQLFQPFNRLGREGGAEPGTGIGLVICRRLVELMQGEIGVESTVGEGSEFWFELPAAP